MDMFPSSLSYIVSSGQRVLPLCNFCIIYKIQNHLWQQIKEKLTNRNTTVCIRSSPFSMTSFKAPGRIFQNSATNSPPLRLLFCRISFARYSRGICCSFVRSRTCVSHVSTTRRAFFRWKMHQWERADLLLRVTYHTWKGES